MACPKYEGGARCGLHSESWVLTQETITNYCKGNYKECEELVEHHENELRKLISPRASGLEETTSAQSSP